MREIEKAARSKYWRAEQAEVVVAAWRSSDEPATVFGRRWGISSDRIRRWAKRLEGGDSVEVRELRAVPQEAFSFRRLKLETMAAEENAMRRQPTAGPVVADIQIGRWSVAVRSGFDAEELELVLEMVAEL